MITTALAPTYADPTEGLHVVLQVKPVGNTFDPPNGSEYYLCPVCPKPDYNAEGGVSREGLHGFGWGTMEALRKHLASHNLRITDQRIELSLGSLFDEHGQVVRYVDDRSDDQESR